MIRFRFNKRIFAYSGLYIPLIVWKIVGVDFCTGERFWIFYLTNFILHILAIKKADQINLSFYKNNKFFVAVAPLIYWFGIFFVNAMFWTKYVCWS